MGYKICIILPVFNVEEYLESAFQSIYTQTIGFENLELIFIDDCSTDNSKAIIDDYAEKYENVRSLQLELNSGVAGKPRNHGLEYVTADYIMFLDPDDVFTKNACEVLYNKAIEYDADMVSGLNTIFNKDGSKRIDSSYVYKVFTDHNEKKKVRLERVDEILQDPDFELVIDSYKDLESVITIYALWTKLFKTEFIIENNIKFAEYAPAEDSIFLLDVIFHANRMVFINDVILEYNNIRMGDNKSVSHQISKKRLFERIGVYYKMYDLSREANETELFIKYLLISKLNYFLTNHMFKSRLSNIEKKEVLEYVSPLFKECLKFERNIPSNLKSFKLIGNDIDAAVLEVNRINRKIRSNNIISIIINADGSIEEIKNCLDNVFNQKYENLQIICIVDENEDSLVDSIDSYSNDHDMLIIEKAPDESWVYLGLINAIGNYIHFIDVDNYFDEKFYQRVINKFNNANIDLVLCNSDNFELNNFQGLFGVSNAKKFNFNKLSLIFEASSSIHNQIYKSAFLDEHYLDSFKNDVFFEDIFCYYYYLKAGNAFYLRNTFCHSKGNIQHVNVELDNYSEYINCLDYIMGMLTQKQDYDMYKQDIGYNIVFKLITLFKNMEKMYLEEYYYRVCDFFNKYGLFNDEDLHQDLTFWLDLFKNRDYNFFIKNYEKLQ